MSHPGWQGHSLPGPSCEYVDRSGLERVRAVKGLIGARVTVCTAQRVWTVVDVDGPLAALRTSDKWMTGLYSVHIAHLTRSDAAEEQASLFDLLEVIP